MTASMLSRPSDRIGPRAIHDGANKGQGRYISLWQQTRSVTSLCSSESGDEWSRRCTRAEHEMVNRWRKSGQIGLLVGFAIAKNARGGAWQNLNR